MLMTYFMAGIAFAVPELIIVYNCKWLKKFIESNPIWELGFSLALSWALAAIMGLGVGVTVAIANVFSTGITLALLPPRCHQPLQASNNDLQDNEGQTPVHPG
jgi:hypothetical protein